VCVAVAVDVAVVLLDAAGGVMAFGLTGPVPMLTLNLGSPLLQPARHATLETFPSPLTNTTINVLRFNGYNSYLDLNTEQDTGQTPNSATGLNVDAYWQSTPDSSLGVTGWTVEGWYQPLSLAHPTTLFSCSDMPPSTTMTGMYTSNAKYSISFSLVNPAAYPDSADGYRRHRS
jgi:hypothetical protein